MSDEIKGYVVSCSGCIFAEGVPQDGCELGRLEKFQAQERAIFVEDTQHYTIKGICNTARGQKWAIANQGRNKIATVEREIQLSIDFVLYSIDEPTHNLIKRVERSINSCVKQKQIRPRSIVIVVKSQLKSYRDLYNTVQEMVEPYDMPFQLVRVLDKDANEQTCLEMGFEKCKSQYTAVFDLNHNIPNNLIVRLNKVLNYDMSRFIMVKPTINTSGMIISTRLAQYLKHAITDVPLVVQQIAKDEESEHLIITWEDLWNQK